MLKIQRSSNGQVIFELTGRMNAEHVAEFEALFRSETGTRQIVLDLKDLTLVADRRCGVRRADPESRCGLCGWDERYLVVLRSPQICLQMSKA